MIEYNANSIVSLSAGRAFREKIGMYLSADRQEAINLGLRELIVNVQDEYEVYKPQNPYCKIVLDSKTKIISVSDNMRGIPSHLRDDGVNALTAAFLIPHSGGKHNEGVYSSAVGINGEGNKVVCHTAKWLKVIVKRDGNIYTQTFESTSEGATATTEVEIIGKTEETGTYIEYMPDPEVYGDIFIDVNKLRKMLIEMSYFTRGLKIYLIVDGKEEIFLSKNGLLDGLKNEKALSEPFSYFYETEDCKVELALQWVTNKGDIKGYANGLFMPDGGAFISGFKSSLTRTFNNLANTKYDGDTIRQVLDGFVSVKVKVGQFSNQAKTALANPEARAAASTAITNALKDFSIRRKEDFNRVVELLYKVAKADAAAERARKQVLEATKDIEKNQKKKVFASDRLKDAENLGQDSMLLLVEGLSAGSSIAMARDTKNYGILMLRGKPISAFTNDDETFYKNKEVKLLLSAMNIVPGKYDSKKLRYGKIGILVDADSDGKAIALLIMSILYKVAPQFIEEGRLYWMKTPLYVVTKGKEEKFYYDDEEMEQRKDKGGQIIRAKGIGSLSPKHAAHSMFSKEFQRLEQLIPDEDTYLVLSELMGEDSTPKHDFLFENLDFSIIRE